MGGFAPTRMTCLSPANTPRAVSTTYGTRSTGTLPRPRAMRGTCVGVRSFAPVARAIRWAAKSPASPRACPLRSSMAGSPERRIRATVRNTSGATRGRGATGRGTAGPLPSLQATSAGTISVAICPGGLRAACTAAAPSEEICCAEPLVRTQCDTARASPSVSAVSGGSKGR